VNRNRILALAFLPFMALFLAACVRSASASDPQPVTALEGPSPTRQAFPFPLAPASTWIYEYRTYADGEPVLWVITETIIAVEEQEGLQIASVERLPILKSGNPAADTWPRAGQTDLYWYILRGDELFRQFNQPPSENPLAQAWRELIFPPESVPCWPVEETPGPLVQGDPGCRYAARRLPVYQTPAGDFENCIELLTPTPDSEIRTIFCPEIGFVAEEYPGAQASPGYSKTLIGYSLQTP
jgi:hypothetical protein